MKYESIGKNIRKFRQERNLRQEDLAEKAGISTNYIGMIERGEKIPSLETFIEILNALQISADMVLCEELNTGYAVKNSLIEDRISKLSERDQKRVYSVIETLVQFK